jgi:hypothetical protein
VGGQGPYVVKPPLIGIPSTPKPLSMVEVLKAEGDALSKQIARYHQFRASDAFKALNPLDAHLYTLAMEQMQTLLHTYTIRLARASDAEKGYVPDTATTLPGGKPGIIKPNGH